MNIQDPIAPHDLAIRPLTHFHGSRDATSPQDRLRAVRRAAAAFRETVLDGEPVPFYRSCELVRAPYPTRYAFLNACTMPTPYIHILNRMIVVQYKAGDALKTLLVSPSDYERNKETPFFKRLASSFGPLQGVGERLMAPTMGTVMSWLSELEISPEEVDYISYDHLHTQDLRRLLGTRDEPGLLPNARLLVMAQEWHSARGLLPPQQEWYCPGGLDGVDPDRVVLLQGDTLLGEGVALMRTPGHTEGNHSFVIHTPEGLMVTSENGVAPDAYAPLHSRIPGLADYARATGVEVILNGNTLEGGLNQYLSMIQEKEVAGPSDRHPDFPNVVCSSEMTAYWAFPGMRPTFSFGTLNFGRPQRASEPHTT